MRTMLVQEYAELFKISPQSVYQRIKTGSLTSEVIDGVKHVIVEGEQPLKTNTTKSKGGSMDLCKEIVKGYKLLIKEQKKEIKHLRKTIKREEKKRDKNYERLQSLFTLVSESKGLSHQDTIEAKLIKNKKEKKRRKNK